MTPQRARLKFVTRFGYGEALPTDELQDGPFEVFGSNGAYASFSRANTGSPVIVVGRKGSYGKINWSDRPVFASDTTFVVDGTTTPHSLRWVYWLLQSLKLDEGSEEAAVPGLNREDAYACEVTLFPPKTQAAIARFLDRETADIDALIAAKQLLLDLLAEKRLAIVAEAVMRGLNPAAPLRPSGIDWLGDIPTHWRTCHLKRVLARLDYGTSESTDVVGTIAILRMGDIRDGELDFSKLAYLDQVEDGLLLREGDLVFNRTNSLDQIGKVALFRGNVDFSVSFASYLVRLRCEDTVLPEYLNWVLNSRYALAWARAEALPSIGQANLNPNRYGYLPIALPPLTEQQKINKHLADSVARLDGIRAATEYSITLLKERRGALIAAAVTGQIDIPEAA